MKFKQRVRDFYNDNKALIIIAFILQIVFSTMTILSMCGIEVTKLVVENEILIKFNDWAMSNGFAMVLSSAIFTANMYFAITICTHTFGAKPLIYCICLSPIFYCSQFIVGVDALIISSILPLAYILAYKFKFSCIWRYGIFAIISGIYTYISKAFKLNLFKFAYASTNIINYILMSIDLFIVLIIYYAIVKAIDKYKNKKEVN